MTLQIMKSGVAALFMTSAFMAQSVSAADNKPAMKMSRVDAGSQDIGCSDVTGGLPNIRDINPDKSASTGDSAEAGDKPAVFMLMAFQSRQMLEKKMRPMRVDDDATSSDFGCYTLAIA